MLLISRIREPALISITIFVVTEVLAAHLKFHSGMSKFYACRQNYFVVMFMRSWVLYCCLWRVADQAIQVRALGRRTFLLELVSPQPVE